MPAPEVSPGRVEMMEALLTPISRLTRSHPVTVALILPSRSNHQPPRSFRTDKFAKKAGNARLCLKNGRCIDEQQ
jgi:hypothetical protein